MQEAPATGQTALCEERRAEQAARSGCEVPVCPELRGLGIPTRAASESLQRSSRTEEPPSPPPLFLFFFIFSPVCSI